MFLNGVVLISAILDFQTARFDRGNDLPYVLILPSYTAAAWYHERLATDLQQDLGTTLAAAERFALEEYGPLLLAEGLRTAAEDDTLVAGMARFTGLGPEFVRQNRLRVPLDRFAKELLRDVARTVGRLDARFTGVDRDAGGDSYEYDASYANIHGAFTAAQNDYVRNVLGYRSDLPYEILTGRVHPWRFGRAENRYLNVAEDLRRAMTYNQDLEVFVAAGLFDLATPYFAAEHTLRHLALDPADVGRVRVRRYPAGHMMYIHAPSRAALKADLAAFYADALAPRERS